MTTHRAELIDRLETTFRRLSTILYDTKVTPAQVDAEIRPYLHERITFVDPWQTETGIEKYRLGLAGFHSMFKFDLELSQVSVALDQTASTGRCIADGVMYLRQLEPLHTYPLRTLLTYTFDLVAPEPLDFKIVHHEEMWSFADMIAAVPMLGGAYSKLFRPAFARGFLVASWVSARLKGGLPSP